MSSALLSDLPFSLPTGISFPTGLPIPSFLSDIPLPTNLEIPDGIPFPTSGDLAIPTGLNIPTDFSIPTDLSIATDESFPTDVPFPSSDSPFGSDSVFAPADASVNDGITSIHAYDGVVWTVLALALISTLLRLGTRIFIVKCFGLDDSLILIGQLSAIAAAAVARWHTGYIWDMRLLPIPNKIPDNLTFDLPDIPGLDEMFELFNLMFRSSVISDLVYLFTIPFIKCSILAFYYRIAHIAKHCHIIYVTAFLIVGQALANILFTIFSFDPPSAMWNLTEAIGTPLRWSHSHLQIANSSFQVLFDIVILLLPAPLLIKTKLRRKDRVGLSLIYLLSFFSLAATIVRLVMVINFDSHIRQMASVSKRIDYSLWAMLEIMTAIICANLFPLTALWRYMKARLYNHSQKKNGLVISTNDAWAGSGSGASNGSGAGKGASKLFTTSVFRQLFSRSVHSRYNPWLRYGAPHQSTSQMDLSKEKKSWNKFGEIEDLSSPTIISSNPYKHTRAGSYDSIARKDFNSPHGYPNFSSHTLYPGHGITNPKSSSNYSAFPFPPPTATTIGMGAAAVGTAMTTSAADHLDSPLILPIMGAGTADNRSDHNISLGVPRQKIHHTDQHKTSGDDIV